MISMHPEIVRIVEAERDRERSAQAILRAVAEGRQRRGQRADGLLAAMIGAFTRSMGRHTHPAAARSVDRDQ